MVKTRPLHNRETRHAMEQNLSNVEETRVGHENQELSGKQEVFVELESRMKLRPFSIQTTPSTYSQSYDVMDEFLWRAAELSNEVIFTRYRGKKNLFELIGLILKIRYHHS